MRELSTLTCLIIFLYDAPTSMSCRADEHSDLIEAIARRDAPKAEKLMLSHLSHIESSLSLDSAASEIDLEDVFRE
jgi:DNA-binding GntR family transcriptional regulator